MFSVPNAVVCLEIKAILKILSSTHFFQYAAIILNPIVQIKTVKTFQVLVIRVMMFEVEPVDCKN